MKSLIATVTAALLVAGFYIPEAEAARVGGGRNTGIQRSVTPPPKNVTPQQQAAPQQTAPAAAAQPAAQGNRWLGPLAGIAAGLGLGWLLTQGGFGGAMGGVILAILGALVLFALLKLYTRQKAQAAGGSTSHAPLQYAGLGGQNVPAPAPAPVPGTSFGGAGLASTSNAPQFEARVPAGFDVAGFVKQAKINFLRLQEANDRGDVETIRDVCTDELAGSLITDINARGTVRQQTEILGLDGQLIEVVSEPDYHYASISFSGSSVENAGAAPQAFQEIWHLRKPVAGELGWQLAGIQQVS